MPRASVWRASGRNRWSLIAALVVTSGALYVALRGVDLDAVGHSLSSTDYRMLAPAFGAFALAVYVRIVRWQLLFHESTRPAFRPAAEALLIGHFFNNVFPARAGEVVRVLALHARSQTSRAEAFATLVVERAFDVLALLLLLVVSLPWLPSVSWLRVGALLAVAPLLAVVAIVVVVARYGVRPVSFVLRPLARLPYLSADRVDQGAERLVHGLAALRHPWLGLASFLLTVLSWLVFALSAWFVALGFAPGLSPLAGVLITVAVGLAVTLPSGPAAIGVFEAAGVTALAAYAIPRSDALSAALVIHALNVFPFLAAGAVVLLMWRPRAARVDDLDVEDESGAASRTPVESGVRR